MSDPVHVPRKEYDDLYNLLETLQGLTDEPLEYRKFFNEKNSDKEDLFDVMKQEIVRYAETNSQFSSFLRENLFKEKTKVSAKSSTASSESTKLEIRPLNPFSPRSSSRPHLRS